MQRIYKAARQCGYLQNVIEPLDPRDTKNLPRDKVVYLCTGSQGEPMGALNRISNFTHPDVFIEKDDTVIFSSKIIPGNVRKHYNVHNKLLKDGINVITEETEFVHVSGHPNREDLKDMYNWIKPNCLIPVHGEHRHMKEQINFANEMKIPCPVQVENGDIVKIYPGNKGLPIFEKEEFFDGLEEEILKLTKTFSLKNSKQYENLIEGLKKTCRKYAKEKTGKKPITNINVIRI
jgi:ribonuclease J